MSSPDIAPLPQRAFFRRWIPARVRQQAGVISLSTVILALVVVGLGSLQLRPIVFSQSLLESPAITENIEGLVDLFDRSVPHTLTITISDVEYEKMKSDFQKDGSKTWIRADAVLDGVPLYSVGIRLKGNSTLMPLRGGRGGMPGGPGGGPEGPGRRQPGGEGSEPREFLGPRELSEHRIDPRKEGGEATNLSGEQGRTPEMPARGGPGGSSSVSFDDPASLPLLVSFNRFTKGRGYQGRAELALRPSVGEGTNLNEALALALIEQSGQASQKFTWVQLRMNGSEERTRFLIENPDQSYAERLGYGAGVLFKSKSTNRFTYQGEDPTAYTQDVSQLSARGVLDLFPLIRLLQFLEEADDETFVRELPSRVDLYSFARYVATQDVLNNFDDMSGPGRNFLIWYGVEDERFKILSWDLNLAITGMGGGGRPGVGGPPAVPVQTQEARGSAGSKEDHNFAQAQREAQEVASIPIRPGGATIPVPEQGRVSGRRDTGGMSMPERGSGAGERSPGGGRAGGGMQHGNLLKERFVGASAWTELRGQAEAELRELWFTNGRARETLEVLASQLPLTGELTEEVVKQQTESLLLQLEKLAQTKAVSNRSQVDSNVK